MRSRRIARIRVHLEGIALRAQRASLPVTNRRLGHWQPRNYLQMAARPMQGHDLYISKSTRRVEVSAGILAEVRIPRARVPDATRPAGDGKGVDRAVRGDGDHASHRDRDLPA